MGEARCLEYGLLLPDGHLKIKGERERERERLEKVLKGSSGNCFVK